MAVSTIAAAVSRPTQLGGEAAAITSSNARQQAADPTTSRHPTHRRRAMQPTATAEAVGRIHNSMAMPKRVPEPPLPLGLGGPVPSPRLPRLREQVRRSRRPSPLPHPCPCMHPASGCPHPSLSPHLLSAHPPPPRSRVWSRSQRPRAPPPPLLPPPPYFQVRLLPQSPRTPKLRRRLPCRSFQPERPLLPLRGLPSLRPQGASGLRCRPLPLPRPAR